MKKILSIIRIDIANSLRDSLVLYLLVAPLLLAGGARLLLPAVEGATVTIAVEAADARGRELADRMERYGTVERYPDASGVRERVLRPDAAGGVVRDGAGWKIVLEGDEGQEAGELMQAVLAHALDPVPGIEHRVLDREGTASPLRGYAAVFLVMLAALLGGLVAAFALIEEKESQVTRAFAVTPLTPTRYFAARGVLATGLGFLLALAGHLVFVGGGGSVPRFAAAFLLCAPIPLTIGLLVGGVAASQIQAIAVLKIVMTGYLTVPFAAIFVPGRWHPFFWPFPNYWMFRLFESVYVGTRPAGDFLLSGLLCAALGALLLAALGRVFSGRVAPLGAR